MEKQEFINKIAPIIISEAKLRGYQYPSAVIGQACIESNFGNSLLSSQYHNYFGMKAGKYWSGGKVNLKTHEEYQPGRLTEITDAFRVYPTMEEGVKGYFDFIKYTRYDNLKNATSAVDYIKKIGEDGYYTSSTYVQTFCKLYVQYNLGQYDTETADSYTPAEVQTVINDVYIQNLSTAVDVLSARVMAGDYGNGDARKQNLGQYYDIVQARVNKLCKGIGSAEHVN